MARPLKAGLNYFPHDTDAVNDDKLQSLMALHGAEGYAFYFIMLERIFRTENGRITIGTRAEKAGLAKVIGISLKKFEAILSTAIDVKCFCPDVLRMENSLTSMGIQKRLDTVKNLREKERIRKENTKEKYKRKRKAIHGKPTENPNPLDIKKKYGEYKHVLLSENDVNKLQEKLNGNANEWIKQLDEGIEMKGYKFNNHCLTILKWAGKERKTHPLQPDADREKLKRDLKQAYQDKDTAQGFYDACDSDDKRKPELEQRLKGLAKKIEFLEKKLHKEAI